MTEQNLIYNPKDPTIEKQLIEELINTNRTILTAMRVGRISDVGIAELYDIMSGFRYAIHHEFENALMCGCKERREKGEI